MGRSVALLALPPPTRTVLVGGEPLLSSAEWCSGAARGRRWWILDIDARGNYVDTTSPSFRTPDSLANYPSRAPIHLRVKYTVLTPTESYKRERVIDAVAGRYLLFGSTVDVEIVYPSPDVALFDVDKPTAVPTRLRSDATLIAAVYGGLAPAGHDDGLAPAEGGSIDAAFTWLTDPSSVLSPSSGIVPIPAGARTVQIFDASGTPWRWAQPTTGLIPTTGGHSARVDIPASSLTLEATDTSTPRIATCVFGVHL